MKAKACTRCRQWKVRCDQDEAASGACTRCLSLNLSCVFDAGFRRTSRGRSLQHMSSEIQRLRKALDEATACASISDQLAESTDGSSQSCSIQAEPIDSSVGLMTERESETLVTGESLPPVYQTLDNVVLTAGQANEHFRTYFARCHHFLPFTMSTRSPEAIYSSCPLLFWAICAAAASWKLRNQLAPSLKAMLADTIHSTPRSIEKVQALLIMSMWPFSVTTVMQDASDFYCGIATQMALQLGLHRPLQSHLHAYGSDEYTNARIVNYEVQTTTWLACFIVNQRQFLVRGIPQSVWVDAHLLKAFAHESVNPTLSRLCRVYLLLMQANLAIGAEAPTSTGMLEPIARPTAIKTWLDQFSTLQTHHLDQMDDGVKIAFLSSRMQVLSFALLDDMPLSTEVLELVEGAKQDACDLIELCYGQNLAIAPAHVRHAISYSGFVLVKILRSGSCVDAEVLQDNIERVRQALTTTTSSPDDTYRKACQTIQWLTYVEDKKLSPPIHTRMGASVVYDLLRICAENKYGPIAETDESVLDLDGFDWTFWKFLA